MPTTLTQDTTPARILTVAVHEPAPIELWLAKQQPYQGRHRRPAAVEAEPLNVHATSTQAAY